MPRPRNIIPSVQIHLRLPAPLVERLQLVLWSELENRVPFGATQDLFTTLLRRYFDERQLDVSAWLGQPPDTSHITATPSTLDALSRLFTSKEKTE